MRKRAVWCKVTALNLAKSKLVTYECTGFIWLMYLKTYSRYLSIRIDAYDLSDAILAIILIFRTALYWHPYIHPCGEGVHRSLEYLHYRVFLILHRVRS